MVPTMEGEFARKRRMMVGLWDIVVGEGMLSPRGYPPLFAFELVSHRLLRYLSPLLHLVALRRQRSPCSATAGSTTSPSSPSWRLLAAALLGRVAAARPAADRPLLRDDDRLDRRRPLGPLPPRRRRALGEGRGNPLMPRAFDVLDRHPRPGRPLALPARRGDRDQARQPRPGGLPPAPRRPRRPRVRDAGSCGRWSRAPTRSGSARSSPATTPASPRRPLPAPHLARRGPQPGQRPARRDGDRRPAPDDPGPGRRLHRRARTAATRSCPGSPAGPRSRAAPASPGRSGSSSTSGTSTTAASPSTPASSPGPLWLVLTGQGLAPD